MKNIAKIVDASVAPTKELAEGFDHLKADDLLNKAKEVKERLKDKAGPGFSLLNAIDFNNITKKMMYHKLNEALIAQAKYEQTACPELLKASHKYRMMRLYNNIVILIRFLQYGEDTLELDDGAAVDYAGNYMNDD